VKLGKKIQAIRISEELSQPDMAQLIDMSVNSLRAYEQAKRGVSEENLIKITNHPRFIKYTLWLMTGETLPESGQICPVFSVLEQCGLTVGGEEKRA